MHLLLFVAGLTAIDIAFFGLAYLAHGLLVRGFELTPAATTAGYAVLWRVFYVQLPLQMLLLWVLYKKWPRAGLGLTVLTALVAFAVPASIYFGGPQNVLKLFEPTLVDSALGEGFVLLLSVGVGWLSMSRFKPDQLTEVTYR